MRDDRRQHQHHEVERFLLQQQEQSLLAVARAVATALHERPQLLGSAFYIQATARPGKTAEELQKVIDEEIDKLAAAPPEARELERALNQIEASFLRQAERVGGFGGKANQLNAYYTNTGTPDFFNEDLSRYRSLDATDISSIVQRYLPKDRRVEMIVLPGGTK